MGFIDWFHTVETWPLADVWGLATTQRDPHTRQLSPCYVDQGVLISDKIQKIKPLTYSNEEVVQSSQGSELVICDEHGWWPEYSPYVLSQIQCLINMMSDPNGLHCSIAYTFLFFSTKKKNLIIVALPYHNVGFMTINRAALHPYDLLCLHYAGWVNCTQYYIPQCSVLDLTFHLCNN